VTRVRTHLFAIAWRTIAAGVCAVGIWCSWTMARADYLFRLNTVQSVRAAIRLEPDAWKYYMHLALLDDAHAQQLLETAIRLDPYNAEGAIELALRFEAAGDPGKAERLLLGAYAVDHTFLPRWSLANFYFRRDNLPAFWTWARSAAEMPSDETAPLFELCWRVSPDANDIARRILNNNLELIRQYLDFLLTKNQLPAAAEIANRLAEFGDPDSDGARMLVVIDRLIAANEGDAAKTLWNDLINKHWVVGDRSAPNNPEFAREPLPVGFDWALSSSNGLHSWPGPSGLETEFSGEQPEDCTIAEQIVPLAPGSYEMEYAYRTDDIPAATGLHWQIAASDSGKVLAESSDLSSATLSDVRLPFSIPPDVSLVRLQLQYRRALGTSRISGTLVVPAVHIYARR
jgi:hypothetical protein